MNPSDSLPLTFLARAYGNLSPALGTQVLTLLRVFLDKHKGDASLRYDYAMCLWKLNEKEPSAELSEQIESLLKTVIAMDPAYADAYLQLGILRASKGEYQAAIGNYKQALELNSSLPSLHYRLGQALARIGETRASREELAIFERLRQTQAEEGKKQNQEIKQFVYTMRNSGVGKARSSEISTPALADSPR